MIHVLVADDHHLVRQGIRALLERQSDIQVIGEAYDGQQAVKLVQETQPDVLVLDINMPLLNGIEVTRRVKEAGLHTQVLILSMYSDESLVKKAFQNGARGYLLKKSISDDLIEAIHSASLRQVYLSPELLGLNSFNLTGLEWEDEPGDLFDRLTARESEVCQLITQGFTNAAIAQQLKISIKTVEKHRANLMEKLGFQDVASLIREAIRHGVAFLDT